MSRTIRVAGRLLLALIVASVCLSQVAAAESVQSLPKPTDYVSDFAHVLSPDMTRKLDLLCGQVDHEADAQIAVVTINTTDGEPIQQYAVDLYQAWGIGGKKTDRGVLFIVATKDRRRFISTGYGLEGILPDAKVGEIGRQMVPPLRANDFDYAFQIGVGQVAQIIADDAGVKLTPLSSAQRRQQAHIGLGQLLIFGIFITFVLIFLVRAGGGGLLGFLLGMFLGGGGRGGGGWGGGDGFGGGGGDGGGSGFDGFGGGSTGGGGAGGDW
ncbi:TPM domain-containing protein [Silvibacterium sp.]|uniref:TPM domain-containing protein n=1 Tax=Silvibacterium sp. TaxID=1964179 RepID=UPI0039E41744